MAWPLATVHSRAVPSALPLAIRCPLGWNASDETLWVCPVSVCRWSPDTGSHSRITRSSPAVASRPPDGSNAVAHSRPVCRVSTCVHDPELGSHTRAVVSHDALASVPRPNASAYTRSVWPSSVRRSRPETASHNRTRESSQPVASTAPSGL